MPKPPRCYQDSGKCWNPLLCDAAGRCETHTTVTFIPSTPAPRDYFVGGATEARERASVEASREAIRTSTEAVAADDADRIAAITDVVEAFDVIDGPGARWLLARIATLEAERDALLGLFDWMESRLTLHEGVEFLYIVDGYEASITRHDGATTAHVAHGTTLLEAVRALKARVEAITHTRLR